MNHRHGVVAQIAANFSCGLESVESVWVVVGSVVSVVVEGVVVSEPVVVESVVVSVVVGSSHHDIFI